MGGGICTWMLMFMFVVTTTNGGSVHAFSCQDAIARMLPCQGFLMGFSKMSVPCCQSAQSLSQIANSSPAELTSVCQCLKQAINVMGINMDKAQQIPKLCHIDLDTALIDPNVDCNRLSAPTPRTVIAFAPSPAKSTGNQESEEKLIS